MGLAARRAERTAEERVSAASLGVACLLRSLPLLTVRHAGVARDDELLEGGQGRQACDLANVGDEVVGERE